MIGKISIPNFNHSTGRLIKLKLQSLTLKFQKLTQKDTVFLNTIVQNSHIIPPPLYLFNVATSNRKSNGTVIKDN